MPTAKGTIEWEYVTCDLCQSSDSEKELDGVDWEFGFAEAPSLVRCKRCGLVYLNPRPTVSSMSVIYPATYGFYQPRERPLESAQNWVRKATSLTRFLRRLTRPRAVFGALCGRLRLGMTHEVIPNSRSDSFAVLPSRGYPYLEDMSAGQILDVGCSTGSSVYPTVRTVP